MPAHIFQTLAAKAKSHHASVTAAYTTYYPHALSTSASSPSPSTTSTPRASAESSSFLTSALPPTSLHSAMAEQKTERKASTGSKPSTWGKIKKAAKDHHDGLTAAYSTYYGAGAPPTTSRSSSQSGSGSEKSATRSGSQTSWIAKRGRLHVTG